LFGEESEKMKNSITKNNVLGKRKAWDEGQKLFYDSRDHKRMWHVYGSPFVENVLDKLISFAGLSKAHRILELGCGAGRYTIPLIQRGYNITGIDISKRMIDKAREDAFSAGLPLDKVCLICEEFSAFKVNGEDKFDAVIGFNILHHLFDMSECFCNISKIIKKDGIVAFIEPNALNPLHYIDSLFDRAWKIEGNKSNSIPSKVKLCMEKNNFHGTAYFNFGFFPPFLIDKSKWLLNIDRKLERVKCFSSLLPYFAIQGVKKSSR